MMICTVLEEYAPLPNIFFKLPLSVTPIRIIPLTKRLRNLRQIQFIAKSSSIYTKIFAPQAQDLLEKLAKILLYSFLREHILLKVKTKKLLRKISSKNLSAGVQFHCSVATYKASFSQINSLYCCFKDA